MHVAEPWSVPADPLTAAVRPNSVPITTQTRSMWLPRSATNATRLADSAARSAGYLLVWLSWLSHAPGTSTKMHRVPRPDLMICAVCRSAVPVLWFGYAALGVGRTVAPSAARSADMDSSASRPADSAGDSPTDTDTPDDTLDCTELTLKVHGEEAPRVGDTWTVFMYCDDVVLNGAGRLSFEPPDFARIDNNLATFLYAGDATMRMQMGNRRLEQAVTVAETVADSG